MLLKVHADVIADVGIMAARHKSTSFAGYGETVLINTALRLERNPRRCRNMAPPCRHHVGHLKTLLHVARLLGPALLIT